MPRLLCQHICFLTVGLFLFARCIAAQSSPDSTKTPDAVESVIRAELDKYLARISATDVDGLMSLWSQKAPDREKIRQQFQKQFQQEEYGSIVPAISRFKSGDGTASLRVGFKAILLNPGKGENRERQKNRNLSYVLEDGTWKVVRDADAVEDLALELSKAETDAACDRLLAGEKELLTIDLADALGKQGARLAGRGSFPDGLKANRLMQKIAERLGDTGRVGSAFLGMGYISWQMGEYTEAINFLRKSLEICESAGQKREAASVLNNIGNVYREQGAYGLAREYYQKALTIFESMDDKEGIAMGLGNLGVVYIKQGNYTAALEYYRNSLAISEAISDQLGVAITLGNIGALYRKQGDYAQALAHYEKSLAISTKIEDTVGIAQMLNNMGIVYLKQGDYSKALELYERNLAMSRKMNAKGRIANAFMLIGSVYEAQGNFLLAEEYIRKGQEIFESNGDREGIANALVNLGVVTRKQGRPAEALELARRATALGREMGVPEIQMATSVNAALALRDLHKTEEAYQSFEEAIATVEAMRFQVAGLEHDQQRFFESRVSPYLAMADLLISEKRAADALLYAERAKARVLLDVIQSGRINLDKAMTPAEREQEHTLYTQLVSSNLQLARERKRAGASRARLAEIEAGQQKARLAFEDFRKGLYIAHPELRVQRGDAEPLKSQQLAALVPGATGALLEFLVTEDKTWLLVVTNEAGKSDAQAHSYAVNLTRGELTKEIETFRQQLAHRELGFRASSSRLASLLLKPAEAQLRGKSNLIIVPDGDLWDLPFQALLVANNRYLIEQAAITYAPSLTVYREVQSRHHRPVEKTASTLLALGNPQLGSETINRAGNSLRNESLSTLPEAEKEVRGLAKLYPTARVYVGSEATEDRIKAEAGTAAILHFATHGTLNNASPMYSSLALAKGAESHEDGLLEAWELMKLDLKADLAVLSACDTARGRFGAGEGMIGLTWALFVAGVPSTVVSQWKVDSAATSALMLDFHRLLQAKGKGTSIRKAEVLRQAALQMMKQPGRSHPFYWAGFVLIGDGK
jgi:CHAT domain-containing protein/uncharacterized protein HemY